MSYTLWSRDRLLGETDLAYVRWKRRLRSGDIRPTPIGERVLLIACGPSAAMIELGRAQRRGSADPRSAHGENAILRMPEYADWLAATVHSESLGLQLRDADGKVIPTTSIHIQDTEFLLKLADECHEEEEFELDFDVEELDPELEAAVEHDLALINEWLEPDEWWRSDAGEEQVYDWDDQPQFPRFQIHVTLEDDSAIPWVRPRMQ